MTIEEEITKLDLIASDAFEGGDANEFKQLAEWLMELKAYRGLSTYNRPCKCYECDYEDSEYYCDDCIWQFVDKFKPKEVKADEDSD